MRKLLLAAACGVGMFAAPAHAATLTPWMLKPQNELTHAECLGAMRHDRNYSWSRGACHMKFIRDAAGVVLRDTKVDGNPDAILKKGEVINITQYRPKEGLYCGHGAGCSPSKDIMLLGSVLTGPDKDDPKTGDESDLWQGVDTSCELILADKAEIIKAGAQKLLRDCH
ncbi:MAG: hypothetical protein WB816_08480 [Methylocystis sp.]